jgi:serine/threonine protein kinase
MSLPPGARLGPYEIVAPIGAGGMGEVYRARDTQLNRDVAIKVLPELFAADHERVARFSREAQTLASLNHPNIAQIYGVVELPPRGGSYVGGSHVAGARALIMELVDGEDLSVIMNQGAMPLADAVPIARQIADALEAAHDAGVIHRDLKPANVRIRSNGRVKVLDFGLAKAVDPIGPAGSNAIQSPTFTAVAATQAGMIVGTAAYMAPEQAKGKAVDKRADIWAFGVVLFEMLTGTRAFDGEDASEVLASVLKTEPQWGELPAGTPPNIRRLLKHCLEKDPRKRLSAIGDARLELDDIDAVTVEPSTIVPAPRASITRWLWPTIAVVAVMLAIAAFVWGTKRPDDAGKVMRLSILGPPGGNLFPDSANVSISPDGTMIAFIVGNLIGTDNQLWVRSLDSMTSRRLDGGDGASLPFWSPDSRRIGFFTSTKLKTIAASGGRAETLADAPGARGGTWNRSNIIVYAPDASGPLYRISSTGGTPVAATAIDAALKESSHRFPSFLPDGKHFLYSALPAKSGKVEIFVGTLDDGSRVRVGSMDSTPVYADPGWLLYSRQGVLAAQPFDARQFKSTGEPIPLPDEPTSVLDAIYSYSAGVTTSVSATGTLAYFSGASTTTTVAWYDSDGKHLGNLPLPPGYYDAPGISPDGTRAVLGKLSSPSEAALWLVDLARGSAAPFVTRAGRNDGSTWSSDGTRVVFASDREGPQNLMVRAVGDAAPERVLYASDVLFKGPASWSKDGQWIVMNQLDRDTANNMWLLPANGKEAPRILVRGPANDQGGAISPDGRWLVYFSDETGRFEAYIQSFPEPGKRQQISQQSARKAWWTPDGRQLLFVDESLSHLWRVEVELGPTVRVGSPTQIATFPPNVIALDATPDRRRFLVIVPERSGPGSLTIVQNWRASLQR